MNFSDYQKKSRATAIYPNLGKNFIYPTLGLAGEAGEVAEKIKKLIRDKKGRLDGEAREAIEKELGDVLWYLAQLSVEIGSSLDRIANKNIEKLSSRQKRNSLHGDGDDR